MDKKLTNTVISVAKEVATNNIKENAKSKNIENSIFEEMWGLPKAKTEEGTIGTAIDSKSNLKKHEKYAQLATDAYGDESQIAGFGMGFGDFKRIDNIENKENGFNSSVYSSPFKNEIVIAYRGSNDKLDVATDKTMVEGKLPNQYRDAEQVYNDVKTKYPNAKITVVGHSLGGSLAQLVASNHDEAKAVTFNSFGTSRIIKNNGLKDRNNCTNYTTTSDIVSNVTPHPGATRTINTGSIGFDGTQDFNFGNAGKNIKKGHAMSNFENLRSARYVDESAAGAKRIITKELTNLVGDYSRENINLSKIVSIFN